jgi:CBS domain-containing protein/ribosome-associated translation inhibitor RaiA
MRLADIMTPRVVTIKASEPASAAWTRMRRRGIRHLVVMDMGDVAGVVSERDLGGRSGAAQRRGRTVGSMMTRSVVTASPDVTVHDAAELMRSRLIGSLPVMEGSELAGIVTATDVFDALQAGDGSARLSSTERDLLRSPASSRRLGGSPVARQPSEGVARKSRRPENRTKREPMAPQLPRATKRTAGRTEAPLVPVNIRAAGVDVDDDTRAYSRRKLGQKLGKFATSIERVSVRLRDVNGPRGGVDHLCQVKVVLSGLPSVLVEEGRDTMGAAIDAAMSGVTRSVSRALRRRQEKPLQGARRAGRV